MSAQPKLNIASIIGIKEGIYQVFSLIDQNLDVYSKHPDKINPVRDCRNYIHQLDGLFEMLELSSITVVSEKMEQLIDALIGNQVEPSTQICDALKQSNKALLYYLNELIDGKEENPMRLFPAYRGLMQAYGFENAPESDLFFPRLTVDPPLKAESTHLDASAAKILAKQIGTEYQAGLLKWFRDLTNKDGLQQMANAVNKLEEFPGTIEERAFWWIACGFLEDLLQLESHQIDLPIRRLCGKIEQVIRHLVAGTPGNTATLLRELLYHLAHSESTSQRIADIKRSYTWPGQTASTTDTLTLEQLEALRSVLDKLRSVLMQANDIWREFCAGQQESLVPLLEYIEWLGHLAQQTECAPLVKLIDVVNRTVTYLHDQPQDTSEELAMEMATALLLVESIIDDFNQLPPDLRQQIDALAVRLHNITTGETNAEELPDLPAFKVIESRTQDKELLTQVAQEILANLGKIESILDKFFIEPAKRSELSALNALFKQISGTLVMLDLERANTLLDLCWEQIEKLLDPDYEINETEQILLVDGLSSLGFFIESLRNGQSDSYQIVEEVINLFQIALVPGSALLSKPALAAVPVRVAKTDSQARETVNTEADSELLDIFLEEADEVLACIASDLQNYQSNAAGNESLISMQRAFHTLKGSGRMVKLDEMSEVAWNVEQVLDHWLTEKRSASDKLTGLISRTHQDYSQWCENLCNSGATGVDAVELLRLAKDLINEKEEVAPQVTQSEADVTRETAIEASFETVAEKPAVLAEPSLTETTVKPIPFEQPALDAEDTVNQELLPVFLEEAQDIIAQIGSKLRAWRMLPQDEDIHRALLRLLHTLKGSARMVGASHLGELIHRMESHVESAFQERTISHSALDQLETEFDAISSMIEQLQCVEIFPVTSAHQLAINPAIATAAFASDKTGPLQPKTVLRINSELVDRLVNDSGEASILRSKIDAQLDNFKQSLQDLVESTHRLHDQLREVEIQAETQMQSHLAQQHENEHAFDPLEFDRFSRLQELTRLMAESVDDIITVQKSLRSSHSIAEEAVAQQSVLNRQFQQSLLQIRTMPFSNYAERYYRIARQVAEDMGKKVNLDIQGAGVEIDRSVLEKINAPLEHLLRNAIAHGIEEPAQRLHAGKLESGQVTIHLRQESSEVIITLSDDGRGLNLPRVREEAQWLGLIQKNEILDDDKITSLIFMQGLSTTDSITGIAGRGIGLDIVKNDISMLGGRIRVNSVSGQGAIFTINLPLVLSVAQTLMVRAGKQTYAIPAFIVEHHRTFEPDALKKIYHDQRIELNGKKYPFLHLSHLVHEPDHLPEFTKHSQVLFLHSGTQYLAIHVDELIGNTEVVVKNAGAQLAQAPGVEGATITGDGEIILILNPVKLLQRNDVQKVLHTPVTEFTTVAQKKSAQTPTIMVVDDSLTVRKVTCRLLEREGCDVLIAKNGAEAMEILKESIPDLMLIDLEMPKMNGFELIKNIRTNPETTNIPIIIISSRTAEKHQKIAKDLGVNVFLGKPYKEEELLNYLSGLIRTSSSRVRGVV